MANKLNSKSFNNPK